MIDRPNPLRSKGFGLFLSVVAALVAVLACGASALVVTLALEYLFTVRSAGGN